MKRTSQLFSFQGRALRESVKLVKITSHASLVLYRKRHKVLVLLARNWIFLL